MRKILFYISSIAILCITIISCTSECYVSKEAKLGISFIDSTTYKAKNITSFTAFGDGNDSILYKNASVSAIYLPLHSNSTVTDYKFVLPTRVEGKSTPDTITLHIEHTPIPQLISEECGCTMYHSLRDVTLENNTYNFKLQVTNQNVVNDDSETCIKILH